MFVDVVKNDLLESAPGRLRRRQNVPFDAIPRNDDPTRILVAKEVLVRGDGDVPSLYLDPRHLVPTW